MKKKLLLTSILTVIMCFSLICGATFALFTSESKINISVNSANVQVDASVKENSITTKSFDQVISENVSEGKFANGGTAKFNAEKTELTLDLLTPGDEASFTIDVENKSNVAIKYRVEMIADGELAPALKGIANINGQDYDIKGGVTKWFDVVAGVEQPTEIADVTVTVSFPDADDNDNYKEKSANILFAIVAVQGNAPVVDVNAGGTLNTETIITDAKGNSAKVPAGTKLDDGEMTLILDVNEAKDAKTGNFELSDDNTAYAFDVKVDGIDNEKNDTTIVVTMEVPADLPVVVLFHEGVAMRSVESAGAVKNDQEFFYDSENGKITFATTHFSNFTLVDGLENVVFVNTADELVAALEVGNAKANALKEATDIAEFSEIVLNKNIKIDPANMSNAYGKTGINVYYNQTLNGNGYTLDIKGAGGTWDSGINITDGTVKNITVTGSFRGIFINHNSNAQGTVYLENVIIDGTTYTISCDQGTNNGLVATGCTFNGWTSFAATIGEVKFTNCNFGEGNGYAFCRPYATTMFVGCTFEEGYEMDPRAIVRFDKCKLGEEDLTAENLATLVTSNIANASIYSLEIIADGVMQDELGNYYITSAAGFDFMRTTVADEEVGDKDGTWILYDDVDLSDINWTPITCFYGTFDGNGKIISNMNASFLAKNKYANNDYHVQCIVKNVTFYKANVTGEKYVGVVVGNAVGVTIENVKVTESTVIGTKYVGGIVGAVDTAVSTITGCTVEKSTIKNDDSENADGKVGGIVGFLSVGKATGNTVTGCTISGLNCVGGIAGRGGSGDGSATIYGNTVSGNTVTVTDTTATTVDELIGDRLNVIEE